MLTQEQQAIEGILARLAFLETREDGGGSGTGSDFTDSGWLDVTYNTGWQDESGYRGVQYRKFGDIVWLRGACERVSGSSNDITTLPTGYRPLEREMFDGIVGSAHARIYANTDGTIELVSGTPNFLTIDIMFSVSDDTGEFLGSGSSDSGWSSLTLGSGWSNIGGVWETAEYRKIDDMVYVRGMVSKSGGAFVVGTLPSGFRPANRARQFGLDNGGTIRSCDIYTDGTINANSGGSYSSSFALSLRFSTT